jgi:cytochrome c oxidase cbb3-type subunit 3
MKRALLTGSLALIASLATPAAQGPQPAADEQAVIAIPLGDLAAGANKTDAQVDNPLAGDNSAVEQGRALFRTMNCAYCHGLKADGVMGPDLTDTYWRYGGTPALIYKSIAEGRPQGMPAWRTMLSPTAIWSIVSYIQSLGGTYPAERYDEAMQGDLARGDTHPGGALLPELQGSY